MSRFVKSSETTHPIAKNLLEEVNYLSAPKADSLSCFYVPHNRLFMLAMNSCINNDRASSGMRCFVGSLSCVLEEISTMKWSRSSQVR